MEAFRNFNLQRAMGIALLFTALFSQIQLLYACDLIDGEPQQVCCCGEHDSATCPMADNCGMHGNTAATQCCDVSYDVVTDASIMNCTSTADCLTLLLDGPQPPPVIEFKQVLPTSVQCLSQLSLCADECLQFNLSKPTYFLTRRLRL